MRFCAKLNTNLSIALRHQNNLDNELKVKIGLEIHARILSKSKIFSDSDCVDSTQSETNSNISYFDAALPGTMPSLNRRCGEAALLTGLALNTRINAISCFERKHYFYADLPAGYQITQQRQPIALKGVLQYPVIDPHTHKLAYKKCRISRIQLEHDSARSLKIDDLLFKLNDQVTLPENSTLVDLNRAGMGLMEIVTEPDLETAFDSYSFVRELAMLLRSIGTCNASMADGGFRVDVNVSVHKQQVNTSTSTPTLLPGTRVELKNLNSFSAVLKATEYEIKRQKDLVNTHMPVTMETRTYDNLTGKTYSIRTKEDQYDYRFMPEPNLLPLVVYPAKTFSPHRSDSNLTCLNNKELLLNDDYLNKVLSLSKNFYIDLDKVRQEFLNLNLPQERREFVKRKFGLTDEKAFIFIANDLDLLLKEIVLKGDQNRMVTIEDESFIQTLIKVILNEYLNQVNTNPDLNKIDFRLKCQKIESYTRLVEQNLIGNRFRLKFFALLFDVNNLDKLAADLAEENNFYIVNCPAVLDERLNELLKTNEKAVAEFRLKPKKREKISEFFIRKMHVSFNDLADTALVNQTVLNKLNKLVEN